MINIIELESRWLKYKIRSYLPYIVIILSLIIISLALFYIFAYESSKAIQEKNIEQKIIQNKASIKEDSVTKDKKDEINATSEIKEKEVIQQVKIAETFKDERTVLKPSLDFMKQMKNSSLPDYEEINHEKNRPQQIQKKEQTKKEDVKKHIKEVKKEITPVKKNNSVVITKKDEYKDIKHVIKRFKKNNNPVLSLFVAKKYYELGEYKKSYNYALITNEINNNIEDSWIIFAKSLVKLNEKDMAVKTLKTYIDHSNSNKAKILLEEITSGKFNAK